MSLELIVTIGIFVIEQAVMFGVMKANLDHNAKEIAELKSRHQQDINDVYSRLNSTDTTLAEIRGMLKSVEEKIKSVDEKVDLIINGKIQV